MATSINCGVPLYVDGPALDGQNPFRQFDVGTRVYNAGTSSAVQVPSGVFPGLGGMQVTSASGMNVKVQAGYCCIANSSSPLQGGYIFGLMNSATLSVAAADTVNIRTDIVVAYVVDVGTSSSAAYVEIITGTPAATPVPPTAPANSFTLCEIGVAANVVSIAANNVLDQRPFVVAPGGILPIQNASSAPAVPAAQFMYNIATGQLVQGTGTAGSVTSPSLLKWVPQMTLITSNVTASTGGALTQVTSVSVTTDGSTDIEIYYKWGGVEGNAGYMQMLVYIDGTECDSVYIQSQNSTASASSGGAVRYFTSSGQGNTPAAGTHTIAFKFQAGGGGTSTNDKVIASTAAPAILRVAPVVT